VARRELAALAEHSPCIVNHAQIDAAHGLLAFDLPYLTRSDASAEPRTAHGFELGVSLPPRFPLAAPLVHFLSPEPIFHPAILASLPFVCIGNHAWSPDVGAAHFVALHVQAVVGSIPIDTMDAFHGDPNSSDAARHYRRLQRDGHLPLARPRLTTRPLSERDLEQSQPETHRAAVTPDAMHVTVRSPMGRRIVELSQDGLEARCCLSQASVAPEHARVFEWMARRLEDESRVRLSTSAGIELALPLDPGTGLDDVAKRRLEQHVRALALPSLALLRSDVADAVADGLPLSTG
jgi:hypothetical protein